MDSESDDGFGRQPGEALEMGNDFDDSQNSEEPNQAPQTKPSQAKG
jgi:intraflagellar transport protein 46